MGKIWQLCPVSSKAMDAEDCMSAFTETEQPPGRSSPAGVPISPQPDQEGNKLQRPNSNFCKPLKTNSEGCPSNQVSAAAMTSASDEKWRPFNCFFQSVRAKDLSAPLYICLFKKAYWVSLIHGSFRFSVSLLLFLKKRDQILTSSAVRLLGAIAKLRKWTVSFVLSVRPSSVCPHGTTRPSLDGLPLHLIFGDISNFVEKFGFTKIR